MKCKFIITCLVFLTLSSCKDNEVNKKSPLEDQKIENNDFFKVTLDVIVKKDDNFHLYYTEDGSIKFTEENSIWLSVKGNEKVQSLVFNLPSDVIPTALRFDLGYGLNPTQSDIEIINLNCNYYGQTFDAKGNSFFDYFYPTAESSVRIPETSILKKVNKDQVIGPILYPNENMLAKLNLITKG